MIFSHVLYQLSYPGIAAAAVAFGFRRAIGSAPMTKLRGIGKAESFLLRRFGRHRRAGQGVAVVEPLDQVAVAAAGGAERGVLGSARFAADRAIGSTID